MRKATRIIRSRRAFERRRDFYDRYDPVVTGIAVGIFIAITLYFLLR